METSDKKADEKTENMESTKAEAAGAEDTATPTGEKPTPADPAEAKELLLRRILGQVEFYFSDSNLPRDPFTLNKLKENDGWLPLKILLTYHRVKALTTDPAVVAEALRRSKALLRVSEDGSKVQRTTKMATVEEIQARTVAVFGLPDEISLEESKLFWGQFGGVRSVRVYRNRKKKDKGKKDGKKEKSGKKQNP